jgi:hypothetical protein
MTKLYVIGNGFDLWHGLPTSYRQFYEFAKEILDELENYYLFEVTQEGPWCDFENSLGAFKWREFYDTHNHIDVQDESFRPSFVYCLEDDLREQAVQQVDAIRDCFREWINEIDISTTGRWLALDENALYLSFNYTSTLETVYGIDDKNVLHIHGRSVAFDELIFGHGDTMQEVPELDENGDSNRTIFSDAEGAAKYPFYALQKPVLDILENNKVFFDSLAYVNEIIVIGHSLNKIDLPYFRRLAASAPSATWIVCFFDADDEIHHLQELERCGVLRKRILFCTYSDLEIQRCHGRT